MAPATELRQIGVAPVGRMAYELADGSAPEYEFGLARIELMGEVTAGRAVQIDRSWIFRREGNEIIVESSPEPALRSSD